MKYLFVTKYLSGDLVGIVKELHTVLVAIIVVLTCICLDLIFGLRKARRNNIIRSSYGLRRTVTKFIQYYSAMILGFALDVICSIAEPINMPYFTFFCAGYIVLIEAKSIRENILDKDDIKDQNKELLKILYILKNKKISIDSVMDLLNNETTDTNENN